MEIVKKMRKHTWFFYPGKIRRNFIDVQMYRNGHSSTNFSLLLSLSLSSPPFSIFLSFLGFFFSCLLDSSSRPLIFFALVSLLGFASTGIVFTSVLPPLVTSPNPFPSVVFEIRGVVNSFLNTWRQSGQCSFLCLFFLHTLHQYLHLFLSGSSVVLVLWSLETSAAPFTWCRWFFCSLSAGSVFDKACWWFSLLAIPEIFVGTYIATASKRECLSCAECFLDRRSLPGVLGTCNLAGFFSGVFSILDSTARSSKGGGLGAVPFLLQNSRRRALFPSEAEAELGRFVGRFV